MQNLFDAHLHIIDPRFPLQPNQGYVPPAFTVTDYLARVAPLGVKSGAVVSGSFQAFDQSYLIHALRALGDQFVGVTQLPHTCSDQEILRLNDAGVRALRFNLKRGGSSEIGYLSNMAARIFELVRWHVELYLDAEALIELEPVLAALPAVSIDHLGLQKHALPVLRRLLASGVHAKVCGFGRLDFDAMQVLPQLYQINPQALMFGSDLPSTRAPRPFNDADLFGLVDVLDEEALRNVLWNNARAFYGLTD